MNERLFKLYNEMQHADATLMKLTCDPDNVRLLFFMLGEIERELFPFGDIGAKYLLLDTTNDDKVIDIPVKRKDLRNLVKRYCILLQTPTD